MADDEPDGPARPTSRGPRVVTGEMRAQARGTKASGAKTATGWAPVTPPPAAPETDPEAVLEDDPPAAQGDLVAETLVGPTPRPAPASRGPRVVTGHTAPAPEAEPEAEEPAEATPARSVRLARVARTEAPAWAEPEPGPTGPVIPPPLHRSASSPPDTARPAGPPAGKPSKAPRGPSAGGGTREPLASRAFLLAVLSLPLAGIPAIPALLVARRAKRRMEGRPDAAGSGLVTSAVVIAVISLLAWLAVAGVVVAGLVRPDGVDYAKLKPGDCIETPDGTEVRRLKVLPCDKPHDAEVFAVVTHPAAPEDPFPGADALLAYAANACLGQPFTDYVGIPRGQSQLTEFEIVPESAAWFEGRRGLVCAVDKADRSPLTASVRGSAQ